MNVKEYPSPAHPPHSHPHTLQGCTFLNNRAETLQHGTNSLGGAASVLGSGSGTVSATECTFRGNVASGGELMFSGAGTGGALVVWRVSGTLLRCVFLGNRVTRALAAQSLYFASGGALFLFGLGGIPPDVSLRGCNFTTNQVRAHTHPSAHTSSPALT